MNINFGLQKYRMIWNVGACPSPKKAPCTTPVHRVPATVKTRRGEVKTTKWDPSYRVRGQGTGVLAHLKRNPFPVHLTCTWSTCTQDKLSSPSHGPVLAQVLVPSLSHSGGSNPPHPQNISFGGAESASPAPFFPSSPCSARPSPARRAHGVL